ncbi:ribonuclease E/G [Nereida sp. MMG025]|uniref:Rne/Rng family ribonuclease n=1 Tax=Nereida sp. MMG025 TaxID=2909981 RepID=UPI001F015EC0|nr:ribonuclease E/G [Nereida sp. MMG025]MCF6443181.1 Rne/Rng family ribonuclease [Nereida sp. MMG025]
MPKKMLIDATHAEETRVVVVDGNKVEEFDFESENKRQLAGNIYLAKVTRVEPSLQAAFVDYGGNRHGFLAFSEIHPDYYQIPVADREALLAEERAYAESLKAQEEEEENKPKRGRRRGGRGRSKAQSAKHDDAVVTAEVADDAVPGMETIDLDADAPEGSSPMELVGETPVETPAADEVSSDAGEGADDAPALKKDTAAQNDTDDDTDNSDEDSAPTASDKDDSIDTVADDDDAEEVRRVRKPRPRRYKIQEVVKVRQILLVQVVKEERGNKGAALTTYLSLAGRYCVLMPNTARGGGISRKITNAADRKKLKEIANEIQVPDGAGLIVRTAGAKRTKSEIKRDYEYLQRLWEQIRELTLKSMAPAKIYEEGNLIKRSIRDLYNREIDEVWVEGEVGYRTAKDFMKMIMPSHAKNVKRYEDSLPLFARHQVETYLAGMFNPTVQLPSGGYIVIGVTEALVAVDVNSGRATKEGSIEQTALKTNLEAADEVARQLRLRDLAGLIVIDFIDMDERKNNSAVEKRMKDKLKTDRARIQVGRISGFGLMEMSRQRLRPGMLEATTQPCHACHGTGLIRSDDSTGLSILRQLEEEGVRGRTKEVLVKCPVGIANFLMNMKREHIAQIEERYGMSVRIEGDPALVSPDFSMEKFKTASRVVKAAAPVVSVDASIMAGIDDDVEEAEAEAAKPAATEDEQQPKKRRRRRRRRRGGNDNRDDAASQDDAKDASADETPAQADADADTPSEEAAEEKPKRRSRSRKKADVAPDAEVEAEAEPKADTEDAPAEKPKRKRAPRKTAAQKRAEEEAKAAEDATPDTPAAPAEPAQAEEKPKRKRAPRKTAAQKRAEEEAQAADAPAQEPVLETVAPAQPEPVAETPAADTPKADKPKRRGWWNLGK